MTNNKTKQEIQTLKNEFDNKMKEQMNAINLRNVGNEEMQKYQKNQNEMEKKMLEQTIENKQVKYIFYPFINSNILTHCVFSFL